MVKKFIGAAGQKGRRTDDKPGVRGDDGTTDRLIEPWIGLDTRLHSDYRRCLSSSPEGPCSATGITRDPVMLLTRGIGIRPAELLRTNN